MNLILLLLILVNIGVFYLTYTNKYEFEDLGASYLYVIVRKDYKRLLTSGFTHSGIFHLLINMYNLYNIGTLIIIIFGLPRFLLTYFGSMIIGQLCALYIRHSNSDDYTISIGASGGIFGLFGVYLMMAIRFYGITSIVTPLLSLIIISMIPGVDKYSHICCLAVGVVLGFLFLTI